VGFGCSASYKIDYIGSKLARFISALQLSRSLTIALTQNSGADHGRNELGECGRYVSMGWLNASPRSLAGLTFICKRRGSSDGSAISWTEGGRYSVRHFLKSDFRPVRLFLFIPLTSIGRATTHPPASCTYQRRSPLVTWSDPHIPSVPLYASNTPNQCRWREIPDSGLQRAEYFGT
jgi:hypothetical protein